MGLHYILQHLDRPRTYVRILFVDFRSTFNTIIPSLLQLKLTQLSVPTSVSQLINSFLTDRQQLVKLGKFSSSIHTISTGAPQGCILCPLPFSLYTFTFMHLADAFIQSDLQCIQAIHVFISMCVLWELEEQLDI